MYIIKEMNIVFRREKHTLFNNINELITHLFQNVSIKIKNGISG